jgi:hypothetical protein
LEEMGAWNTEGEKECERATELSRDGGVVELVRLELLTDYRETKHRGKRVGGEVLVEQQR